MPVTSVKFNLKILPNIQYINEIDSGITFSKSNLKVNSDPFIYGDRIYVASFLHNWQIKLKSSYCFNMMIYSCWESEELNSLKEQIKSGNGEFNDLFKLHKKLLQNDFPTGTQYFTKLIGDAIIPEETRQSFEHLDKIFETEGKPFTNFYKNRIVDKFM